MAILLLLLLCLIEDHDGVVAKDDMSSQLQAIREENAAIKQQILQLAKETAKISTQLDDMPKSYVPRVEHDLRDHQLEMLRADMERRIASNETLLVQLSNRQYDWLWDMLKMFVPATLAGGGVAGVSTYLRNREAREEAHKRRNAEQTVTALKGILKKLEEAGIKMPQTQPNPVGGK